ncbi:hypothetical protein PTKIN_Ptkin14bG0047700 [Pterospermum kingtungense]
MVFKIASGRWNAALVTQGRKKGEKQKSLYLCFGLRSSSVESAGEGLLGRQGWLILVYLLLLRLQNSWLHLQYGILVLRYVFCFASNVEGLRKETEQLTIAQGRLQNDVNEAIRQTEEIEKDVENWLAKAREVLEDVKSLETEIEENKRCFHSCPSWRWHYQLSKKIEKKKLIIVKLQETSNFQRVGYRATLPVIEFLPSKDFMPSTSSEKAFNQIMEALMDDDVSMIGLYGMAGVGKTTLAKEVGKKAIQLKLFDLVVIAVVSQTPDIENIQGRIADLLDLRIEKETLGGRAAQLWPRLQENKILVILDDVWKELNLKAVGIPHGNDHKGCKVLLTTRLQDVCIRMRSQKKIQLDVFSNDEAWTLFKNNAGLCDDSGYDELNDVARKIAGECKGLPLAIVTIARALREKTLDEWMVANQQLKSSQLAENQDVCEDIYGCLKFSYNHLRGRKSKSCFLLCSLFPEDYEIIIEQLTRYGIGQGLFQDVNFIEDARREMRVILTNLHNSGLLLDTGNTETVKMHDVIRDFAHWLASEGENFFMIKAGLGLDEWPNTVILDCCKAISLMNNRIEYLPDGLVCPKLETLLLSGNEMMTVSTASFEGMKSLKVLTLSSRLSSVEKLLHLTNLKCLCLERCGLENISILGKLKKLEILDIRGSKMETMTSELGELNCLRLLDLSYSEGHWMIPPNLIGRLSKLEELYIGDFSFTQWAIEGAGQEATTASLSELKSLLRLNALAMHANSLCLPKDFVFPKLQRHKISINQCFDYSYPRSRSLKITRSSLSPFKELFCNIEYLDLDAIVGHQRLVPSLDQGALNKLIFFGLAVAGTSIPVVESLKRVTVINCPKLRAVFELDSLLNTKPKNHGSVLSNLTCLELQSLPNLRCIWEGPIDHVSLQSLKTVTIQSCSNLTSLFPPVLAQGLLQLETLEICDCPGLKHVITETIDSDSNPMCLPKLTILKISSCDILEYVFPISMDPDFRQLKEINVTNCPQLTRVFSLGKEMDGKDIVLRQLQSLVLKNLNSLSTFCPENCVLVQPSLEVLEVEECPLLAPFIFEDMRRAQIKKLWLSKVGNNCQPGNRVSFQGRHRSTDVEYLTIGNCVEMFQLEGGFFLLRLEIFHLKDLQQLQVIWKGPKQTTTLQNLTHLEIVDCKRLRHIFSPMFAPNFLQLKHLNLQGCEELEEIIVKDQTSKGHFQFPNLTKLWIKTCNKLKCVFPLSAARGLQELEELKVEGSSQLEQVFGHEDEANTIDKEDMVLPMLKSLKLLQLPNLVSFSPYHFMFPSWLDAIIEDCPNMTMCFTVFVNNLMLGRTQKLRLQEEENCSQLSKTQEHFLDLKELKLKNCGVEEVFQLKGLPLPITSEEIKCYCSILRENKWEYVYHSYKKTEVSENLRMRGFGANCCQG